MKIVFEKANIITLNSEAPVLKDAYLMTDGRRIAYVGSGKPEEPTDRVIDCKGGILMPGLVNAHTHSPMSLLRGLRDDCPTDEWLTQAIWPAEESMTDESIRCGTLLSVAEMLAYGTVSFSDMYRRSNTVAEAIASTGIKANICESIISTPNESPTQFTQLGESIEMVKNWNNYNDGLIRCDTSIQSIFQTTPTLRDTVARFASDAGIGIHIHLAETQKEQQSCIEQHGKTPAALLWSQGIFDSRVVAAHGTFLSQEDIDILSANGASLVHDPASNLKTCCVTARLKPFIEAGVNVALGTDGVCSNNSADLFETMKQTALLQKAFENDPSFISAEQVLHMAVTGGWISQGRQGESGVLCPGYDADLILLDGEHPGLMPSYYPISTAVYSAHGNHVKLTMVRGEILYEDGVYTTIDLEKLRYKLSRCIG